jgi:hypothetical protein
VCTGGSSGEASLDCCRRTHPACIPSQIDALLLVHNITFERSAWQSDGSRRRYHLSSMHFSSYTRDSKCRYWST